MTSWRSPVTVERRRDTRDADDQVVLGAGTAAVDQRRAGVPPSFERSNMRAVDRAAVEVELADGAELGNTMPRRPDGQQRGDPNPQSESGTTSSITRAGWPNRDSSTADTPNPL